MLTRAQCQWCLTVVARSPLLAAAAAEVGADADAAAEGLMLLQGCTSASTWAAQAKLLKQIPATLVPTLATGKHPLLGSALAAMLADMVLSDCSCTSLRAAVKAAASALPRAIHAEWASRMSAGLAAAFPLPQKQGGHAYSSSSNAAGAGGGSGNGTATPPQPRATVYGSPEVAARLAAVRGGLQTLAAATKEAERAEVDVLFGRMLRQTLGIPPAEVRSKSPLATKYP